MRIDTSSYEWWKHGKKPNGVGYYSFEVTYANGKMITYSLHGDYEECLERVKEESKEKIIEIIVGI